MVNLKLISVICSLSLLFLASCSNDGFDTSKLQKQGTSNGITTYEPINKERALELVPFEVKLPDYLPFIESEETPVTLSEWKEGEIVFSITYLSSNEEKEEIEFIVANFERFFQKYQQDPNYEKLELSDGTPVYFNSIGFPSVSLHWMKDGVEYNLHHSKFTSNLDKVKKELMKMADSIR